MHRMAGFNTLWVPGIDHAGIATQAVVEKQLKEKEGKTRHDVGREALVERIWQWKQQYGDRILEQLKRLGCSCDWSRTRFTLDEHVRQSRAPHLLQALQERPDLPRQTPRELGRLPANLRVGRRDLPRSGEDESVAHPVSRSKAPTSTWWWRPRAPKRCSATPPSPCTRKTRGGTGPSANSCACRCRTGSSRSSATRSWSTWSSAAAW